MSVGYCVFEAFGLLYIRFAGRVSFEELADAYIEIKFDPKAGAAHFVLNDYRRLEDVQFLFDSRQILASSVAQDAAQRVQPWRLAIVTNRLDFHDLAVTYADDFNDSTGGQVVCERGGGCAAFLGMADAVKWLGLEDAVLDVRDMYGDRLGDEVFETPAPPVAKVSQSS